MRRYSRFVGREPRRLTARLPSRGRLVCGAFDPQEQMIIEAKASTTREHVRMAIGQLLDYQLHLYRDGDTFLGPL
ncbi:hypothetical protein LX15_001177 [Streptoalloteichus tenebrarius]|uniref:Uncharacterized protein n=1 Tax=Streptoalloteichus tenebrarius (strain ATCC 17920 / DSM 40477 / JCM 4838 / CBS 697.72 / NBRC 16177 / NCIMB 11028 / NRRL B-12390 / A12253. 1 / ISP 5477) TaxID=1933 RepID=A0ABT1HPQ3_STRSD|nr:hypothetical protein [Streptoalloteichus tenebrarius]MCP2257492.1 hypothetical protein [Streptoalloteichus tenebrarius]BFE98441.1 hypothetical protein GCM10020241_01170 [Streptoalloteichus tenebrarius]